MKKIKTLVLGSLFTGALFALISVSSTSALTYQESVDVKFTFNPTVNISLSSANLIISNLAPGNYADSNIINVVVSTNNETGYTLYATAGDGTTYTNTNLINGSNNFSSVSTSADLPSMNNASDNEWAYSFSTNSGSTWSNYSGLPYYTQTGKTLFATNTNTPITVNFKIGAKASSAQPSGTYRNIVNFIAVTNPMPPEPTSLCALDQLEMQNVSQWGSTVEVGDEVTACDNRDGKTYTVARLADGNLWMTQNLDFDIVDGGADLDSTNTDVPSNWADAGNLTDTYATNDITWNSDLNAPESYDPGDLCWNGTIRSDYDGTLANSTVACTSDRHYHIGNYYDWTAAVAMADSSGYDEDNTDVNQSLCPAGWTLPKTDTTGVQNTFSWLATTANLTAGPLGNIHTSPYYFVYGGYWTGSSYLVGNYGHYWSPTVYDDELAFNLYFNRVGNLDPANLVSRDHGLSVRCLVR